MTEKELIILLKEGDEKAFTTLYRRYWSKVYNFSRLYLSSILEIEEVVQEVFVKFWNVFKEDSEGISVRSYLYRMVRNACIDLARAKKYDTVDVNSLADQLEDFFQAESEED